jgi:glycosyltransferase involved in cell wall biosynthesis
MNLQLLVSTMQQTDYSLLEKMNIQSDSIIINQCNKYQVESFEYNGNSIRFFSFAERGIGLSRNNALMRATSDIALFGDEDVIYVNNYKEIILDAFADNPMADVLIFNVPSTNPERPMHISKRKNRVRWFNCLKYGAVRIAVKTEKIKQANIYFSLLFGGGAKYSAGEDSLFIAECVRKRLKVYTNTSVIGYVTQEDSSWFEGYTDKYFIDKGIFYASLSKKWAKILCLQFAIRHYKIFIKDISVLKACKLMIKGTYLIG